MEYRVCSKGIWDTSVPGIEFDADGVSNYAHDLQSLFDQYPRGEKGSNTWDQILSDIKRNRKSKTYDCIIGVSGGTDSCYLLHLAKQWGLNPLAVNVDNGFNSKIAVENINKLTKKLKIDLQTYIINYDLLKTAVVAYMKAGLPWIDAPTDMAIKSVLFMMAKKNNIKYVMNGHDFRSEGKQPLLWTASDSKQLRYLTLKFMGISSNRFPCLNPLQQSYYSLILGIRRVNPFYYLDYNKSDARDVLQKEYDWQYYGEHHHENALTKFVLSYWLYEKFGIDKRIITYSGQVLAGMLDREEALKMIAKRPYDENTIDSEIEYVLKKLSIHRADFDSMMKSKNHFVFDYPSYLNFIIKHKKLSLWIFKNVLKYEPLLMKQIKNL